MVRRSRDAEAELNLPPGFRFHPTDEELVLHYLCRKVALQFLPVSIIAEVDLYKYDPWVLPEKAMFGQKEWYFFTPRDRKYPNGSRPNRAAGSGYWKATGADKPVTPPGSNRPLGIKKALVFYTGKAPKGTKTNWIMHEYRLADTNRATNKKGSLRLDDWVLCRLYNKKSDWEKEIPEKTDDVSTADSFEASESRRTSESDVDNDVYTEIARQNPKPEPMNYTTNERIKEDNDWFMDLNLDDLQNPFTPFTSAAPPAIDMSPYQDSFFSMLTSPRLPRIPSQPLIMPF